MTATSSKEDEKEVKKPRQGWGQRQGRAKAGGKARQNGQSSSKRWGKEAGNGEGERLGTFCAVGAFFFFFLSSLSSSSFYLY